MSDTSDPSLPAGQMASLLDKQAVLDVIRQTAQHLDNEDMTAWLALFAADGEYEITTFGPEIKSNMVWWKNTRDELEKVLAEVDGHIRDPGRRLHVVTPISVDIDGDRADALSHFIIARTGPDGDSAVYAAGRYEDQLQREGERWTYSRHKVLLDTRKLEIFTHLPL